MPEYVRRLRSAGRNDTRGGRRVCREQSRIGWGIWGVWQAAVCLGMAFPGVPVGAVRRTYGEWSGGCGGMRSIPIWQDVLPRSNRCAGWLERKTMPLAGPDVRGCSPSRRGGPSGQPADEAVAAVRLAPGREAGIIPHSAGEYCRVIFRSDDGLRVGGFVFEPQNGVARLFGQDGADA